MRIGIDAGGTFTDVVALDADGRVRALKLPSQPRDPAAPVLDGARRMSSGDDAALELIHSTTVATNALLERSGGPTALVTTAGFEDVLELGRQTRPELYALHPVKPPPLVDAAHRFGLDERLAADGSVLRAPTDEALAALVARVRAAGARSIAICLLHAYANPAHERAAAAALAPLGLPLSLSSEVLPLMREYERTCTTVVDAYVAPVIAPYLGRLDAALPGARLRVMQSSGGALPLIEAAREPVRTLLSGPAAGVIGAHALARAHGLEDAITFDMGGTSTDVALILDGELPFCDEAEVAGVPLQLPMLAVHSVGAGGGSIARVDAGRALKVGPESAGADPGPAAYGRGGARPTVTDAHVALGRLPPSGLIGGALALSVERARAALGELAVTLGASVDEVAEDVLAVADALMARAIKVVSVERGRDPAQFTLVASGGAGGLHACRIARELGVTRVFVPPSPGLLCAYGALVADVTRDFVVTLLRPAGATLPMAELAAAFLPLTAAATQALDAADVPPAARRLERTATLRYRGQSFALTIPATGDLVAGFTAAHRQRYGYTLPDRPIELVTLRLRAVGKTPPAPPPVEPADPGPSEVGRARCRLDGREHDAPLLLRRRLTPGALIAGPALICEYSATTVLEIGWRARVLDGGALDLTPA